jgi:hypothetical protein
MACDTEGIPLGEIVTLTMPDEPPMRMTVVDAVQRVMAWNIGKVRDGARMTREDGEVCTYLQIAAIYTRPDFPNSN